MNASWQARMAGVVSTAKRTCPVVLLVLSGAAAAQIANWNTVTGNWGNANNWDCVIGGASSHCIPGSGFVVTIVDGDVTLDVDASVARISGNTGSFTLSGRTLTLTDPLGFQVTNGLFTASGSLVNGFVLAHSVQLSSTTVNGNLSAFSASIANSTTGALSVANDLTLANSNIGPNSLLNIASIGSSISNSTISGQFNLVSGGELLVDAGSLVNSTQTLVSTGILTIKGGSAFNATSTPVFVGLSPGSASILVTGAGSALNLANAPLELGLLADAFVAVDDHAKLAASGVGGDLLIGLGAAFTTHSTLFVDNAGSASAHNITVSGSAIGSTANLTVAHGSSVTATGQLLVASGGRITASTQSSFAVDSFRVQAGDVVFAAGATLDVTSATAVLIGSAGTGTLTFQSGATGSATGELVLGTSAGSSGTMTITDSFSKWDGAANVSVGDGGTGSLTVRSGGALVTGSDGSGLSGSIGTQRTGNGNVTVQGGDWRANGTLNIGAAGTGTLQLSQGGTVESGAAVIGASAGSTGAASVSGAGSTWRVSGALTVGSFGNGSLGIFGAGQVFNTNGVIGDKAGSSGSVTVSGPGSLWQNSGLLSVGGDGGASLTVDGGAVTAGGASIGSNFVPVQVTVTNHGALNVLGDVSIGGAALTTVTIQNGATFDSGVNATIGGAGGDTVVTVTGTDSAWTLHGAGNLTVDDKGSLMVTEGGTVTSATITVLTNGVLNAQGGHIVGNVFNNGGTVTPGDATGVMTVTGNFAQRSGVLLFEIDGVAPSQFDRLLISGLASLTGGSIDIVFGAGFVPAAGESFDLLSAALGFSLSNVDFTVIGLPADLGFTETIDSNGFQVAFVPVTTPVDEPHTWALLALGAPLMGWLMRRRAGRIASP